MRRLLLCVLAAASPAIAADELKFGKTPHWVVPQAIPTNAGKAADAPVALLLADQQIRLEPGKTATYVEVATKIQKSEGLSAGNISIPWNPATDTVTVNKLEIHRGTQLIDVIASGQKFTTMRRESGLEAATLNGILTANIQPEGLQEGDVIDFAATVEHVDPVIGNHVEANFAAWPATAIRQAHARVEWPASLKLSIQAKGLTAQTTARGENKVVDISAANVEPIIPPKGAPPRFGITRLGEATDFTSWSDVSNLMQPLFRKAEAIPGKGALHDEVEKIRATATDPKLRATLALQLVQDRVRYVALLMGQGGYVPADADTTWSRRFGDCKAKTALLLGILHALGIEAEPLLVQSRLGDAISDRLPMLSYFDHVLVRAHLGGKTYYLDGTRTGDTSIADIEVPNFGWGLPVVENARLVQLVPPPLDRPESETQIAIDASAGIYVPADVTADQVIRGDFAVDLNSGLSSLSEAQRRQFFDNYWKKNIDDLTPGSSSFTFDKTARQLRLSMQGKLKLDWSGGFFHLPMSSIGYAPDTDRPEGPSHDAPFAVGHPVFARAETKIRLPEGFFPSNIGKLVPEPVHRTLIGVEYSRVQSATPNGMTVQTTTKSLVPEVSYKEAIAASDTLKAMADGDVSVRLPPSYHATAADLTAMKNNTAGSASDLVTRGNTLLQSRKYDDALSVLSRALELEPKNVWALADRGLTYVWKKNFDLADKDFSAALAVEPDNSVALSGQGLEAELKGDCESAVEAFAKSLHSDSASIFVLGHRANCENILGRDAEALADSAQALKGDPSWMDLRVLRANIFVKQGQNDAVAKEADLLIRENPQSTYAFVAAGKIYARLQRTADAMRALDAALAIKPEAFVYINRAQSRPFSDKSGRLSDLDAALKLEPNNSDALAEKAEQLAVDGDFKGARELYDRAIKASPEENYYKVRRAVLLFKTGDTVEARKLFAEFRAAAKLASEFNGLCWTKGTAGILLDAALDECQEALKRKPDTGAYLDSLALVELRLNNVDAAIADYSRAIAKNITDSYMGRALAYSRKGDRVRAEADLKQALQYDPDAQTRFAEYGLKL